MLCSLYSPVLETVVTSVTPTAIERMLCWLCWGAWAYGLRQAASETLVLP